jgi:hypothetical protein
VPGSEGKVKIDTSGYLWTCLLTSLSVKVRIRSLGVYVHIQSQMEKWRYDRQFFIFMDVLCNRHEMQVKLDKSLC